MGNSRTPSPAAQKWKAWRASPYKSSTPIQRLALNEPADIENQFDIHRCKPGSRCPCDNREKTGAVKDPRDLARALVSSHEGGYDPDRLCPRHNLALSRNGMCSSCGLSWKNRKQRK